MCENRRNRALIRHVKQEASGSVCVRRGGQADLERTRMVFKGVARPKLKLGNEKVNDGPPAQWGLCGYELLYT